MRAAFPPDANLTERFRQTQIVRLQGAEVISQDQSQATLAVDLVELDGQSGRRHFVGNWYLVRRAGGWILDRPQLNPAPQIWIEWWHVSCPVPTMDENTSI